VMRAFHEPAPVEDVSCVNQKSATWGIVRSSQVNLNIDGNYYYLDATTGDGVTVYVIDTGILTTHTEFASSGGISRARWGTNTVDTDNTDGNGHGTHCAGTIGGTTYGMAKDAILVAVKVLNKQGSGTTQGVIDGINWAVLAAARDDTPSLGSMSLGGGKSEALNSAVDAAATNNPPLPIIVAAGNDNKDAASVSPASAPQAIAVAASDNTDKKASFSNWGKLVALYAPGVAITSSWIGSNTATNTISGTSMACPHVAGQSAKFMQTAPKTSTAELKAFLVSKASSGLIVNGAIGGTPNLLLFADCKTWVAVNSTEKLQRRY